MDINEQSEALIKKIRHFIIATSGRTESEASIDEFYQAFVSALREGIMINWTATWNTWAAKKPRTLYYISMEYLPGRLIDHNIANIGAHDLVKLVLSKMNRRYSDLLACEDDPSLGNGGLGRLASCLLDSLATFHYPAIGYGLRYQYGVFQQEIWNGMQIERPDCWLLKMNPWETRRDEYATLVHFRGHPVKGVNSHGDEIYHLENFEEVRALPYDMPIVGFSEKNDFSVLSLRLWSTKESPRNFQLQRFNEGFLDKASENTSLTDVLYPNDQTEMGRRVRLKQELLLVSASLKDIIRQHLYAFGNLNLFADKVRIQINDTHPALIVAELIRILTKNFDIPWDKAVEITRECCSYTNHTILSEGLEEWSEERMKELLPRQFFVIQKLNQDFCQSVRRRYPHDEEKVRRMSIIENGRVRLAPLAISCSRRVNGVAKLHSEILQTKLFHDFYEMNKEQFVNVTNGVTQRRWLFDANPLLSNFISERIGRAWIRDFSAIAKLAAFANDLESQKQFLAVKEVNKEALANFLTKENPVRDSSGKIISYSPALPPTAIYDVQVKRIHEYKRQLLNALHLIMLYQEIIDGVARHPRMALFGGKAAAGYARAKEILRLIGCIARTVNRDPAMRGKLSITFIENYNVSKAEIVIPGADLSEQISTAGWEASGTGNMKFAMNGALTIGTDDGANVEMRETVTDRWWPFKFGASAKENANRSPGGGRVYAEDQAIRRAVDTLESNLFAENAEERVIFTRIKYDLLEKDRFFVLGDLRSYYDAQKKVEELFRQPNRWAETAIHNIAAMGRFSTDESIRNYVNLIWNLKPCPPDPAILADVRKEYSSS